MKIERKDAVRFNALLELSASDNKEEARTAAYLACKILRDIGMRLRIPPLEKKEEDMGRVKVRVHRDEMKLEIDCQEHLDAGWKVDEAASIKEINATGVQCIIMKRGEDTAKFSLADIKSEPPRSHEGHQEERETATSLDDEVYNPEADDEAELTNG